MRTIPPIRFNEAMPDSAVLSTAEIDELVPSMVADLVRVKNPKALEVKDYLERRAGDVSDRATEQPIVARVSTRIRELAESVKLDASLFGGFLDLCFAGQTKVEEKEAYALIQLYQWLLSHTPTSNKRTLMIAVREKLELLGSHPQLDNLRSELDRAIDASGRYHGDEIEPQKVLGGLDVHRISRAEIALMDIVPRWVGRKGVLDRAKLDWYVKARAEGHKRVMQGDFPRVDASLRDLEARARFLADALPEFHIVKLRPDSIPDQEIRDAARAVAAAINDQSASTDGTELNATELRTALAALGDGGDPVTRKLLLAKYNEVRNVRIDGAYEAQAARALRKNLEVVMDFMTSEHNALLQSGFAALEIGDWSRPVRRPQSKVAAYFALPNEKGELDYQVRDEAEAKAIHEKFKEDLRQTELNVVTFLFENRVWVAVYPWGDLESIMPGRTEVPLFDFAKNADGELGYRMRGTGKVIGKIDPLYSSRGEAVFRTAHRLVATIVRTIGRSVANPEERGETLARSLGSPESIVESLGLATALGVAGISAINPTLMWGLAGISAAPSAFNLLGHAIAKKRLRPIYELLGAVPTPASSK